LRFQSTAAEVPQEVSGAYLIETLEDSNFHTIHAKPVAILLKDMQPTRHISGERA
uniref:Histone domain-containing protein n=1 Tax=Hymenolepis diminuta TaxID=6216 RepID=A0A0R3SYP4_HYMDI